MLHHYQAKSLDEIYLEDIPQLRHPDSANRDLAHTEQPNRIIKEWDLPIGYGMLINKYRGLHFQAPYMAYRDVLQEVRSGKIVLLKNRLHGEERASVLTRGGNIRENLPLHLYLRLKYLLSRQIRRPVVTVRTHAPEQPAQTAKTINSKAAGRLLAAGGIYNGNIEGFRKTAEQLGGDAPTGYGQVMNEQTKGLLIAGASVAAGVMMGRMKFPELEELEHFGARGASSSRNFDPEKAGGPIEKLTTDGVVIDHDGIAIVEKHLARFDHDPANDVMVSRLKNIAKGEMPPEQVDLNYYTHECREYTRYCKLGWETGEPEGDAGYELWNNAHTATLEDFQLKDGDLFHPDATK